MSGRRVTGEMKPVRRVVKLSSRDLLLFRALAKARVMRANDCAILIYPSLAIARRRLRRLLDGGYLICTVHALHEENRWELGDRGQAAIGAA